MQSWVQRALRETAVGAVHQIFHPDHTGEIRDPLRHQLRVFDVVGGMGYDARYQNLALRLLNILPQLPFVFVTRVGRLNGLAAGVHS